MEKKFKGNREKGFLFRLNLKAVQLTSLFCCDFDVDDNSQTTENFKICLGYEVTLYKVQEFCVVKINVDGMNKFLFLVLALGD